MSDVDVNPVPHLASPDSRAHVASASYTDSIHHSRTKPLSGDVAMERDRSRDGRNDSRGRGGAQQRHRGSVLGAQPRLPSSSPSPRVSRSHRGREKKRHDSGPHHEDSERRLEERRHSQSPDRRERYLDDTRRGRNTSVRDDHDDEDKRHGDSSPRHHSRTNDYSEHPRDRSFSPSSRKRRRSRSPLPFPSSRSKRSRRDRDRRRRLEKEERFERDHQTTYGPPRHDRAHSSSRKRSISPHHDASHRRYAERSDHPTESRPHHRSRSPHRDVDNDDRPVKPPHRSHADSKIQDRSISPRPASHRSSVSHTHSPTRSIGLLPTKGPSDKGPHSHKPSPGFEPPKAEYPRSPKDRGSRRPRRKPKHRDESRFHGGGPLASGANSIEVSFRRTDRRNSFEVPGHVDSVPVGQASPVNSNLPHHGSPTSPHLSDDGGHQHSPRGHGKEARSSQHLPQDRNFPNPSGHTRRRSGSRSPPRSPSESTAKDPYRGRGFSRGGFRGGMAFGHSGLHMSSRHSQWTAPPGPNRDVPNPPDHHISARPGTPNSKSEDREAEHAPKPPRDSQVKDATKNDRTTADQMPPPRPPPTAPTGPSNSKFSFAFKTSNKNPVATPKPEISQKFSATPRNETAPILDDRDRDLPKHTPREPASARARAEYHNRRALQHEAPKTRKVMKTRRKLKPKPPLDPELAQSSSVYFRKPGNESVIGSGTYGKVFKGKHVYTNKLVALKRIRMEGERDGFPVTAMREVKLLQSLRHTNIVDLHEVMIEKNECYMVFEYLSHDLTGLLNHPTYKLDAAQKKHLTMQLFGGLDYLHKRGVLHRDIKAANILVSNEGILKLADFGLARFFAKRDQQNYTNRVITIWYRPPELLLGETQYGAAVDIWSAACVMVEIFTRRAIFPGDGGEISQLDKIYDILGTPNQEQWPGLVHTPWFELIPRGHRRPNVFADKYRERLPAAAFDLLVDMFQYDPVKRPTAAEVLEHPYFITEQPPPRQAVELKNIKGDWHEFESKALRREKEKQEKQQRDTRRAAAAKEESGREKEKKRPPSPLEARAESKRLHVENTASRQSTNVLPAIH
ncbi:Pkinase-domain-containing protein [Xylaria sp. CBS 124048]|nr:Pkinase-domain-containing protein [Xylaria sp. CBS 124048]